ncbi:MAG: cobalt-precorrin-5B (C(1))-methyltransferase [Leptospirales bacterium]
MKEEKPKTKLRTGYTTGACAAAATRAAMESLLTGKKVDTSTILLPVGESVTFQIVESNNDTNKVTASVIKDGGDDPDVTHGAKITSIVQWTETSGGITIEGGEGVGKVTLPGLPVAVGEAAINPVPRKMIHKEVEEALRVHGIQRGVRITISVAGGEKIAEQTMNPRLGIIGGISILGTRGIVIPFSTSAYRHSLVVAARAAAKNGVSHVILSTGARSEIFGKKLYPALPLLAFIEAGEFIGFAVRQCRRFGIKKVTFVSMIGKLSKVAGGVLMVHSKKSAVNFQFLSDIAREAKAKPELCEKIKTATTAALVSQWMSEIGNTQFFDNLVSRANEVVYNAADKKIEMETCLINSEGELLSQFKQKLPA